MKVLYMVGHNVRKGQAVCLDGADEPVRFFGEKRASAVRAIVERFNRMQLRVALVEAAPSGAGM
jgi:hypothetical protein